MNRAEIWSNDVSMACAGACRKASTAAFFRKKYDAQQVLARFALTARDETDLDALTAELVNVVQETMQPASVSIWLKPQEETTTPGL